MNWQTHTTIGINSLWLSSLFPSGRYDYDLGALVICAMVGALLPDLDAVESKIKHLKVGKMKPFRLPSEMAYQTFGHRGAMHSLIGWGVLALMLLLLIPWIGWGGWLGLQLGYLSHLLADSCTRSGIPLFFPKQSRFFLLPKILRLRTGSQAEDVVFVIAASGVLYFLLSHFLQR